MMEISMEPMGVGIANFNAHNCAWFATMEFASLANLAINCLRITLA